MKRYKLVENREFQERPEGEWVRHVDAQAEVGQLRNDLTAVTLQRDNAIRDARQHYGRYIEVCDTLRNLLREPT